jgi:hypothetical protein
MRNKLALLTKWVQRLGTVHKLCSISAGIIYGHSAPKSVGIVIPVMPYSYSVADFKPFPDGLKNSAWLDGIANGVNFQIIVLQGI